jgi:ATP-dependent helicase/nuclease subunit A
MTAGFAARVDALGAGRDDGARLESAPETSPAGQSHPYPEKWLKGQIEAPPPSGDAAGTVWGGLLLKRAKSRAEYWLRRIKAAVEEMEDLPDVKKAYAPSFMGTAASLEGFIRAIDAGWDEACKYGDIDFPTLGRLRGYKEDGRVNAIKAIRELCKKRMKRVTGGFDALSAEHMEDAAKIRPCPAELFRLVLDFASAYSNEKRRGAFWISEIWSIWL